MVIQSENKIRNKERIIPPLIWKIHGIVIPELQYQFHPDRRWRFDYSWPGNHVAVEINGGVWIYGRHNRAKSYIADLEKINTAQCLNWIVLQYIPQKIDFNQIRQVLQQRKLFIEKIDFIENKEER